MPTITKHKLCPDCGETKDRSDFYIKEPHRPSGGYPAKYCKKCFAKNHRQPPTREQSQQSTARYRERHPEALDRGRQKAREYYHEKGWMTRVVKRYGITAERYWEMFEAQNGGCAICLKPCRTGNRLAIDHDHRCCPGETSCGKCVRGLLCLDHNRAVGSLQDDPVLARKLADYLEGMSD